MTAKRNISKTAPVAGSTFVPDVADTVNGLARLLAGVGQSVAGTNTVTMTLEISSGLAGPVNGMTLLWKPVNANTGAVTLNIGVGGAKALRKSDGTALSGGELTAGTVYLCQFLGGADNHWRILSAIGATANAPSYPMMFQLIYGTGTHTWTAPWDCDAVFIACGAGGSGGKNENNNSPASGGGAGGISNKFVTGILSGETASINVGTGGAAPGTAGGAIDGNAGGNTTVTSSDFSINLSCSGGEGGNSDGTPAAGGTATGGDANYQGGGSGTATGNAATGGGAVGVSSNGKASANATTNTVSAGATAWGPAQPGQHPFLTTDGQGGAGNDAGSGSNGGPLCGGGGGNGAGATINGGAGGRGGGGGAGKSTGGYDANGGVGGNGFVIVVWTPNKAA